MTDKKRPAPADIVDDLLDEVDTATKRNMISDNPDLAAAIARFLDLKASSDERVQGITLSWFYVNKLRDRFGGPRTMDTVRSYVRDVLKRDHITGAPNGK